LDISFFVGNVISGVGLGLFGRGHLDLGPNCKSQFFDSSFYWKLGYDQGYHTVLISKIVLIYIDALRLRKYYRPYL